MRSRAYSSVAVKQVQLAQVMAGHAGQDVVVGIDIAKRSLLVVVRFSNGEWARPWCVSNPDELPVLVGLLQELAVGRQLRVAVESSGTYGDALRQALADAGVSVVRVSSKAAHDYAEIFDGVPSQHDGKDAAVIAELAAQGKAWAWPFVPPTDWAQEVTYWVRRLETLQRTSQVWQGQLEALLARHWPAATSVVKGSSATLLRALAEYSGPTALAADAQAAARLQAWSGGWLAEDKIAALVTTAQSNVGVRTTLWDERRLRDQANNLLTARQELLACQRALRRLAKAQPAVRTQGCVVGAPTACLLWVYLGEPQRYHCAAAYRKGMGLNLRERSSGEQKGQLHLSKRGPAAVRRSLYFAALRLVQRVGLKAWYAAKKEADPRPAKRIVVAVMRQLALALYHVGARDAKFDLKKLFAQRRRRKQRRSA